VILPLSRLAQYHFVRLKTNQGIERRIAQYVSSASTGKLEVVMREGPTYDRELLGTIFTSDCLIASK
jgi:hypothetical protein